MKNRQCSGFTLVEILVVLVITGYIVAILLQSLQQVFRLQTHFGREIFQSQNGAMYADWFRQSINGLMPEDARGKLKFRGEPRWMSGLTLTPLDRDAGTLTSFIWRLEYESGAGATSLRYGESDAAPLVSVINWQGDNGRFIYLDSESQPHESWPPFIGKWPQLPSAIYLQNGATDQSRLIIAAPRGPETSILRRKDWESL